MQEINALYDLQFDFLKRHGNYLVISRQEPLQRNELSHIQVQMMLSNDIPRLLPLTIDEEDCRVKLMYAFNSKRMLMSEIRGRGLTLNRYYLILMQAVSVLLDSPAYMLNEEHYILNEHFIFLNKDWTDLYFTYLPLKTIEHKPDVRQELKELAVRLIRYVHEISGSGFQSLLQLLDTPDIGWEEVREHLSMLLSDGGGDEAVVKMDGSFPAADGTFGAGGESMENHERIALFESAPPYAQQKAAFPPRDAAFADAAPRGEAASREESAPRRPFFHAGEEAGSSLFSRAGINLRENLLPDRSLFAGDTAPSCEEKEKKWLRYFTKKDNEKQRINTAVVQPPAAEKREQHKQPAHPRGTHGSRKKTLIWPFAVLVCAVIWFTYTKYPSEGYFYLCLGLTLLNLNGVYVFHKLWKESPQSWTNVELAMAPLTVATDMLLAGADSENNGGSVKRHERLPEGDVRDAAWNAKELTHADFYYQELGDATQILSAANETVLLSQDDQPFVHSASRPMLIRRQGDGFQTIPVAGERFIVGRDAEIAHVVDETPGVSRQHFEIVRTGGKYGIRDLGSSNGTLLNDALLVPYKLYPLKGDDRIVIVGQEYRFSMQ
jgi:hypothetical protein